MSETLHLVGLPHVETLERTSNMRVHAEGNQVYGNDGSLGVNVSAVDRANAIDPYVLQAQVRWFRRLTDLWSDGWYSREETILTGRQS